VRRRFIGAACLIGGRVQLRQIRSPASIACALVACLVACVGSGEGVPAEGESGGEVPRTFGEIQTNVIGPMCAAPCHFGGAAPKGLSLEANVMLGNLVGVGSVEVPGMVRVLPGHPEDSYLITKVVPADPRRVSSRMPRTGPPFLTSAQVNALRQWIKEGAKADWVQGASTPDILPLSPGASDDAGVAGSEVQMGAEDGE